ncbi:MAG: methionyl-tRNA formyltransferase [Candidatus Magasanikbacteria bacterium CG10_big_fil_rev_8_21_14_0_10_43_6]|uniref:Methionyl-tRNA formyltransferase n=1 Tax=Candidatus Magasanikbacteria bacterium CG10_big_fil_rev_8_21_14_0_10_43_6 TaxID=1974650 RepID=A0A2M6W1A4_9BACT|nr:MAG: methionyl-tRNA formyltransferase [Candidatus Magasanikbacteria bacterium CG10_big_fil_rev_8_21_14_0_10_43_6]
MKLHLLVDNPKSWIVPYVLRLQQELIAKGHAVTYVSDQKHITEGDCAFFLGCEHIVKQETLDKNTHNLVIHESALPAGKGWSPLTWQILAGENAIPVTLFEAQASVDSGDIYAQTILQFEGHELNEELKHAQGEATMRLVHMFVDMYPNISPTAQQGTESFYEKRTPKDSELDINKTIQEQFNLLRVVDNERYPAYFMHMGKKYILRITKEDI